MTASGTTVYPGIYKAYCFKKNGQEISTYIPQLFGPVAVKIKDSIGVLPDPDNYGYVSFEGGDPSYPVWIGSTSSTPVTTTSLSNSYAGAFEYTGNQAITSTTDAYAMPFNVTDFSNKVDISNTSHVNIRSKGLYNVQWSGQFQNTDSQLGDIKVWIRKNGSDIAGTSGFVSIPNSHGGVPGHAVIGWNYFLQFNSNDYFELVWSSSNTAISLISYAAGTSPVNPSTSALILTVSMV